MTKITQSRGIYLLPNLLTTSSLFAAFYAIVALMQQRFELSAIAIFIGVLTDSMDGRVARLTNTQTAFGAEYDSLADMVTFGVAPALLCYQWSLHTLGKIGWLIAFFYTACVAMRLARFNVQVEVQDKKYFQGLACTAGSAFLVSVIWLLITLDIEGRTVSLLMAALTIFIALLMVSNVRYYSFKGEFDFKGRMPFISGILGVFVFVGIAVYPSLMLLTGYGIYALSGPTYTIILLRRVRKNRNKSSDK